MARGIEPSQENPFIEIGRLISDESYRKERKEIHLQNMVIDLIRRGDKEIIIGEVKKSSRFEKSARMQLAFYLYRLKVMGVDARGELLFPKEKKRIRVILNSELEEEIKDTVDRIQDIISMERPPHLKKTRFCSKCGYNELCWA